ENGHVLRILDLLGDLIQREPAEAVESGGDQYDVFLPFDPVQSIQRVIQSVENIGLGESWHAQLVQRAIDGFLILGEIHQNVGLHVVVGNRDPVVFGECVGERVGSP